MHTCVHTTQTYTSKLIHVQTHEHVYFGGIFYITTKNSEEQVLLSKGTLLKGGRTPPQGCSCAPGVAWEGALSTPPPTLLKVIYGSNVHVCLKSAAEFILAATYSTIIGHCKSAEERVINGCDLRGSKNTGRMREN